MNLAQRFSAYVLLTVFLFVSTPVHLIHELIHHHDTVESHDGSLAFDVQHVHCELLQLSLPAFSETQLLDINEGTYFTKSEVSKTFVLPASFAHSLRPSGRAPPAV